MTRAVIHPPVVCPPVMLKPDGHLVGILVVGGLLLLQVGTAGGEQVSGAGFCQIGRLLNSGGANSRLSEAGGVV